MTATWHFYFASQEEADAWLDFEAGDEEIEQAHYAEPDRYTEWQRWQAEWKASMA